MISELRLTQLGRVGELAISPDGGWLAVSVARLDADDAGYVNDLWRVPLDGSPPSKITSGAFNDRSPRFDGDRLFFLSNRPIGAGEAEKHSQVWAFGPHAGDPTRITDEPLGVGAFEVAAGTLAMIAPVLLGVPHAQQREHAETIGKHGPSAMRYTSAPVRHWDHWLPEAAPHLVVLREGERRDLTPDYDRELRPETELKLDPEGRRALVVAHETHADDRIRNSWLRVFDLNTGEHEDFGRGGRTWYGSALFFDGGIVATRSERSEKHVHTHELIVFEGGETRVLAPDWDRRPVPQAMLDASRCLVSFDDHGEVRAATIDLKTGTHEALEEKGSHGGLQPAPEGFVGIGHSIAQPPRPFRVVRGERRWLAELSRISDVEQSAFVEERFGVESTDGVSIDTRLIKPRGEGPFPTVLWIHGGPISHFGDQWHWRWNPLVLLRAGYAIALPNARGSTGYGYDFIDGIWGNVWGEQCYADLMAVTDVLEQRDDVDARRIAAMGGSFGGYMVNWIGGMTDRFAALVSHAGLFDLRAFYGATDAGPYFGLHNASTPWSGEIDRCSPHVNVSKWKTPTLVLHGEKDYRVPVGEALSLFEALQAHGVDSELVIYPDENHWILKPRNIRHWYGTVISFLDRHLPAAG